MLAGTAVAARPVVVGVELDEVADDRNVDSAGADVCNVGSAGPVPHAVRTPASVVAANTVTRSPRMVPYPPLSRRPR